MKPIIIACVSLLIFGSFGNYMRYIEQMPDEPAHFEKIPESLGGYVGEERRFDEESYGILQADTTTLRLYVDSEGNNYWLFVAYFSSQKYGSQIHSPRHCLPGGGWKIESNEPYLLPLPGGDKLINLLSIKANQSRQLMLYWFETRSGVISNEFGLKLDLMKNSLLLRPTDAAIVRLTVSLNSGESQQSATKRAVDYFETFHPSVMEALPFSEN